MSIGKTTSIGEVQVLVLMTEHVARDLVDLQSEGVRTESPGRSLRRSLEALQREEVNGTNSIVGDPRQSTPGRSRRPAR